MKHYVVLFQDSPIAAQTFVSVAFYKDDTEINRIPEIPHCYLSDFQSVTRAKEALIKDDFRAVKTEKFGGITLDEFVLNGFGALTAIWYDEAGEFQSARNFFYSRSCPLTKETIKYATTRQTTETRTT